MTDFGLIPSRKGDTSDRNLYSVEVAMCFNNLPQKKMILIILIAKIANISKDAKMLCETPYENRL